MIVCVFVCLFVCNRVKRTLSARILSVTRHDARRGISMRGTWIRGPNTSKPHWSAGNQWKSSLPETGFPGVSRRGEHESEAQTPRTPIGRPGTNGNRVCRKHLFLGYLDAGNTNPGSRHVETTLVVHEYCLRSITIQREVSISVFWVYYHKHGFKFSMMYKSWNEVVFNSKLSSIYMTEGILSPKQGSYLKCT